MDSQILGLDIGGTGIKLAIVDVKKGTLLTEKMRELTPQPATPDRVARKVAEMIKKIGWNGPVGCGFPSIIRHNVCLTATNIEQAWVYKDVSQILRTHIDLPFYIVNDADAAGMCEMAFGRGKGVMGTVILLTLGTGIGSAIFHDGHLYPNSELGSAYMYNGQTAEEYASNKTRKEDALSYDEWGKRFNELLFHFERLFSPDLFILGGGLSKKLDRYEVFLDSRHQVTAAEYLNDAGVVGAALYASGQMAIGSE